VVEIINSAGGASEVDIIDCLQYLYRERGLKPGTKNGPRHFSWFPTVVGDYFRRKREREETADPVGSRGWSERRAGHLGKEEFDFLTDAIEINQTN
jgi:hypothetical protein